MRAIDIAEPGKESGRLLPVHASIPQMKSHEILIRVSHAGVNRADILQRMGMYPPPEGASSLPGLEVSGHVAAAGTEVTKWRIGDSVCALLPGGGYAEYAVAHANHVLPVPQGWNMAEAAAFPEAIFTVWMALIHEAQLQPGETMLVHGGASGIGMTAIQFARALGATPFATAGTPEKCAACREWGAEVAVHYKNEDFVARILEATGGQGVNVILDIVGGAYITRNFKTLATEGRLINIAFLGGSKVESLSLAPLLLKRLTWKGATLRARSDMQKAAFAKDIQGQLWNFIASGVIKPSVDTVFSLEDAQKAHNRMEQNLNIGKIVLQV